MSRRYTDAEKAAYYKKKAAAARKPRVATVRGYGAYNASKGKKYYKAYKANKSASSGKSILSPPDSIGATIGGWLGHGAQKVLQAVTGFGDYNIGENSLLMGGMSPPQIVNSVNTGGVILRHREYIMDVTASTTFTNTTLDINPGISSTFPWLSQVAQAFELYRLRGLIFEFKSMSSDAVLSSSASSALGTVIMATQYNSLQGGFTSTLQMENHEFANASKPSCDFYHPVECKRSLIPNSELYVRFGDVPSGGDIRLFDIGQFNIATTGMQNATGVIGQLWCTYEVELYQHQYSTPAAVVSAHAQSSGCASATPLGTAFSFAGGNSVDLQLSPTTLTLPSSIKTGRYLAEVRWSFASGAYVVGSTIESGMTILDYWQGGGTGGNSASGTTTAAIVTYVFDVTAVNAAITFFGFTIPTGAVSDIWITQVDSDIQNIP